MGDVINDFFSIKQKKSAAEPHLLAKFGVKANYLMLMRLLSCPTLTM